MIDTEDKKSWCEAGSLAEKDFVATNKLEGWGISMNPTKHRDPYTHDFMGIVPMDLKSIREPWRKSQELFGIPFCQNRHHLSFEVDNKGDFCDLTMNLIHLMSS